MSAWVLPKGAGLALVAGLLLVVSLVPGGQVDAGRHADEGRPELMYLIMEDTAGPLHRFEAFDAVTFAAFDLNGDGTKEIITHNDNNNLYVFDGATGEMIAELTTVHPREWEARELAGPSVGDVTGNGFLDIVVTNSAGWLAVFETRPGPDPGDKLEFEVVWEILMDPRDQDPDYLRNHPWAEFEGHPGLDGSAYLADANGDGRDEIFLQLDDMPSLYKVSGEGEVMWWVNWSDGNANPIATDFTGDGQIEVMYPSDGGLILLFHAESMVPICTLDIKDEGVDPGSISVSPTVVDLTGDGALEIVFGARHAVEDEGDPEWYMKQNARFFAVTAECEILWDRTWDWANPHVHMHPVPVDVTGNGQMDVVFQDWNTVGHRPGNWEPTGKANLFAVEGSTGNLIWQRETESYWSNKNIALADVNVDGDQELLVVEPRGGLDGVMFYSLQGDRKGSIMAPEGWAVTRGPGVADLDGDGRLEVIIPLHRNTTGCERELDVGCREGALAVYKTQGTGEPGWSNIKTYNHRYDFLGEPRVVRGHDADVHEVDAEPAFLAVEVSSNVQPERVHARVPGSLHWHPLEDREGDVFSGPVSFSPAPGDEVRVRVYFSDARVGVYTYEAEGHPVMLEAKIVDRDADPVKDARVVVSDGSGTIWSGPATTDGRIRIPLDPGEYTVDVSASGYRDASQRVIVEDDGVTFTLVQMQPSLVPLLLGVGGAVVVVGGLAAGGYVIKRRKSPRRG